MKYFALSLLLLSTPSVAEDTTSCTGLTDSFCQTLWMQNEGVMPIFDGEIRIGKSPRSEMSLYRIDDLRALIAAKDRLPVDLRARALPILNEMEAALAAESNNYSWYRQITAASRNFHLLLEDVAQERTEQKYPALLAKRQEDLTVAENRLLSEVNYDLSTEILDAKYKQHANWLRIEALFTRVKADLTAVVEDLGVSSEQEAFMKESIRTVQLSLPYEDDRLIGSDPGCGSTTVNAYYSSLYHKFVVCAGYFNAFVSPASLYFVMAHEIGHAIDSNRVSTFFRRGNSRIDQALQRLKGASAPVYTCEEWQTVKRDVLQMPEAAAITPFQGNALDEVYACVLPRRSLDPFIPSAIQTAARQAALRGISAYATAGLFLQIAQPTIRRRGSTIANEFYLRPDRLTNEAIPFIRDANIAEIFLQELSCQSAVVEGEQKFYPDVVTNETVRSTLFEAAIREVSRITEARITDRIVYEGLTSPTLEPLRMARNPQENFSDWIAGRAMARYFAEFPDVATRRMATAASTVLFCEEPGVRDSAPNLALLERRYSLAVHPDTRLRRISVYNDAMKEIAECSISPEDQGYGSCEP